MLKTLNQNSAVYAYVVMAALCIAVCVFSVALAPQGARTLTTAAEGMVVAGSTCSDFLDGVAVGMGVGVLFGCVWCGAGAVIAKGIALFC